MIAPFRPIKPRRLFKQDLKELEIAIQLTSERLHELYLLENRFLDKNRSFYPEYRKMAYEQYKVEKVKLQRKLSFYSRELNEIE